jgi:MFS family permease
MKFKKLSPAVEKNLILISTIFYWSALYIYVPILSPYAKELGGSLTVIGLVVSSYGLTQLLFRFPVGIWSDNSGRRKPFVISGFLFALASCIGLAMSPNPWILLIFRGLSGVSASMWVAYTVMYSGYFHDSQSTRSMSLITFFTGFSQMISTYFGGIIAEKYGWLAPFYWGAGLSLLGALVILPVSENKIENRVSFSFRRLLAVASHKRLLIVSIITALSQFSVFVTTYGFLPIYATDIGASKSQLGVLMFVIHLTQTLSMYLAGTFVAPRFGYKITVCFSYVSIAFVMAITPYIQSIHPLILANGLGAFGRGFAYPILMGLAIQGIPLEEKATAMGFYQAVYAIGMFLGPAVGGFIGDAFGLKGVFFCAGAIYLTASIMSAFMLPGRKSPIR